jgi:hypothetical protein
MPSIDSVILSGAKDPGTAREASFAGATDLLSADQMLHFVQHDRDRHRTTCSRTPLAGCTTKLWPIQSQWVAPASAAWGWLGERSPPSPSPAGLTMPPATFLSCTPVAGGGVFLLTETCPGKYTHSGASSRLDDTGRTTTFRPARRGTVHRRTDGRSVANGRPGCGPLRRDERVTPAQRRPSACSATISCTCFHILEGGPACIERKSVQSYSVWS